GFVQEGRLRGGRGSGRKSPEIYPTSELSCLTRQD
ncbi:dihydrolipoamide acetyltransferase, partial [Paraburkholderia sp. CNPSo 3155]|nr:dihydrolipoamide acetyltransferase [Paraburkholderia atlantica]NUY36157.1 dihydrolipoamide acetyltransferase [Paraburkholderia atlantica]